jgi:hypothetical protein
MFRHVFRFQREHIVIEQNREGLAMIYRHKELGREIESISGHYSFLEEIRLNFRGRDVLCNRGVGIVDSSCCGVGGCGFIEVSGYIVSWKAGIDDGGKPLSELVPITDEEEKSEIRAILAREYPYSQIMFAR